MTVESTYKTAQVAAMIGVATSSMRKYALTIEKYGGIVQKDDKGDRFYTVADVNAFKRLRQLTAQGMTLDNAAEKAAELMKGEQESRQQVGQTLVAADRALLREALDGIKALRVEVTELRAEVGAERIKERQAFMIALNEVKASQEAAAAEVDVVEVTEEKPGLFGRMFGRRK